MGNKITFSGIVRGLALDLNGLELTVNTSSEQKKAVLPVSAVHNEFDMVPYDLALKNNRVTVECSLCGTVNYIDKLVVEEGPLRNGVYTSKKYNEC